MNVRPKNLEYRMYCLTMYNLSGIQRGIQSLHAVIEYANKFANTEQYKKWALSDKTVIILNGGTSNDGLQINQVPGSMEQYKAELIENSIKCAWFNEPDLNLSTSGIAFLADERVWDYEKYPDFLVDKSIDADEYKEMHKNEYQKWVKEIGGEQNAFLKQFIQRFKLA